MRPFSPLAALFLAAAPVSAEGLRVVTDIPVTHGLVLAVAGEGADVTALVEGGADPHSFQMRPSQARALAGADLVIWVGPELTPWLDRALEANAAGVGRLTLLEAEGVFLRELGSDDEHGHDAHAEEGHEAHGDDDHGHEDHADDGDGHAEHVNGDSGTDDHDHAHAGVDPHAWLDPANAEAWAGAIAEALATADPEGAEGYRDRARALIGDIRALDTELAELLAPAREARLVFQHDAYGYLTEHYGVVDTAAIADVDGVDPGAGRISDLTENATTACVFGEVGQNPSLPQGLADGIGTGFAILDPTGAEVPAGPGHYRALMTGLASAISACITTQG